MRKILSIFLVIGMLAATCTVSAATFTDINEHWAKKEIEAWSEYGVISGYNGEFSPNRNITRGEFAVVLNRLMAYQSESVNSFSDLPDMFYTSSVLKLNKAGVMQGYDGKVSPEASLTREEASVMICRALGIETADKMDRAFSDDADVSLWSKPYINAMVNAGLLNGSDGKLNPKNPISRAEVVKILDNAVQPILKAGTFEKVDTNKILVISASGVVVKKSAIGGKVIITQGVLDGKVSFEESKIEKAVVIDNDRSAFIELKNTQVTNKDVLTHKAFIAEEKKEEGGSSSGSRPSGGGGGGGGGGGTTVDPCASGHKYGSWKADGNEYHKKECSCGDTVKEAHKWDAGVETKAPTETETGIKTYTCSECSHTKSEEIPATGNSNMSAEIVEKLMAVAEDIEPCIDKNDPLHREFTNPERIILEEIKVCIDDAIANHADELDADFIKNTYSAEIKEVHAIYDDLVAEGEDDKFIGKLAINFATYNLIWLADTLGIDLERYGIDPSIY